MQRIHSGDDLGLACGHYTQPPSCSSASHPNPQPWQASWWWARIEPPAAWRRPCTAGTWDRWACCRCWSSQASAGSCCNSPCCSGAHVVAPLHSQQYACALERPKSLLLPDAPFFPPLQRACLVGRPHICWATTGWHSGRPRTRQSSSGCVWVRRGLGGSVGSTLCNKACCASLGRPNTRQGWCSNPLHPAPVQLCSPRPALFNPPCRPTGCGATPSLRGASRWWPSHGHCSSLMCPSAPPPASTTPWRSG